MKYPTRTKALADLRRRGLTVGAHVRCQRTALAKGSWYLYDGKTGTVTVRNIETFCRWKLNPDLTNVEIGVQLTNEHKNSWFEPDELVATGHSPSRGSESGPKG